MSGRTNGIGAALAALVAAALTLSGCSDEPGNRDLDEPLRSLGGLETRTFELRHLRAEEAAEVVRPYVFDDRPSAPGAISHFPGGLTVRETPDNLERIERVLERFDRPQPGVRLHFQIIEADGFQDADPEIADVEAALRQLFRFEGYRLVADAQVGAMEGSGSSQVIQGERGEEFGIFANVGDIRTAGEGGSVELTVELMASPVGRAITTSMTVPVGRTVILGSARPDPSRATLILTVRPELVRVEGDDSGPGTGGRP